MSGAVGDGGGGGMGKVEDSAVKLLTRACELDQQRRYTESLICYQEGIQMLIDALKYVTDDTKRQHFRGRVKSYMDRAESVKRLIEKEKAEGTFHEVIKISENETGHSYDSLFSRYLDQSVREVTVRDPYLHNHDQLCNFLRLCELLVRRCRPGLRRITLYTKCAPAGPDNAQKDALRRIADSLRADHGVTLDVELRDTLHDREITLDTGWVMKIGRGLDIHKAAPRGKFSIGYLDRELRLCRETTVDIFHTRNVKDGSGGAQQ